MPKKPKPDDSPIRERYVGEVGKPPPELPEDHPDRWQREYQGSKAERDGLLDRLAADEDVVVEDDEGPPQEESLF